MLRELARSYLTVVKDLSRVILTSPLIDRDVSAPDTPA
jgi:hypothetical protein